MLNHRRLPVPSQIDAVTRLDEIEDLSARFERRHGFSPEAISHWDPKPDFEEQISSWLAEIPPAVSLVRYVYSSYLNLDETIRSRLREPQGRGFALTPSGTSSLATVLTYLANVGIKNLHIVTPSYFAVEAVAKILGLKVSFWQVERIGGRYRLPRNLKVASKSAVWLTLPVYGASSYIPNDEVAANIDVIREDAVVVVDESLAYPDKNDFRSIVTLDRVLRISTPHKALCVNGEKVSIISFPEHLSATFNSWNDCFAGGIGSSGLRALQFFLDEAYDRAVTRMREMTKASLLRMHSVLGNRGTESLDVETDGHFVMLYWPKLPMSASLNSKFMSEIVDVSGALPIPASRNRHLETDGFAFRINLMRLDAAGLGGLKRLVDELDLRSLRNSV